MPLSHKHDVLISQAEGAVLETLQKNGPGPVEPKMANSLIRLELVYKKRSKEYGITHKGEGIINRR